ncbi:MAG TPA: hypothetical protein VD997_04365 [Phycisphaerales bacterium]|nr:hypothetical protein [Phycisphaerales bacterium]
MMNLKSKGQAAVVAMVLSAGTALVAPLNLASPAAAQLSGTRVPAAPSSIAATVDSTGLVRVTWQDNSNNELGFRLVRETRRTNGSWTTSASYTLGANVALYTERPGTGTFRYKVRSYNSRGNSSYTSAATVTVNGTAGTTTPPPPPPPPTSPPPPPPPDDTTAVPAAPTNFAGTPDGTGRINLTWTDNSNNETAFWIERTPAFGGNGIIEIPADWTAWGDTPGAGTFQYRMRSRNANGTSAYTPWITVNSSIQAPAVPAAPTNFTGTPDGQGGVTLAWTDNSDNETAFWIERTPAFGGNGIVEIPAGWTSWRDTPGAGTFQYKMRSHNGNGESAYTSTITVNSTVGSTQPPPPPPPPPPPSGTFPVLPAGTGFTSASPEPGVQGSAGQLGYTAKAIARWDVVPYQTITGNYNIGVVAFHLSGINRVEFSLNGGAWTSVSSMALNPTSNVWEYTATINASSLPDGPFEVRARVIPNVGVPRVLQDSTGTDLGDKALRLYANAGGTLPNTNRTVYVSPNGSDTVGNGTSSLPFWSIRRAITHLAAQNSTGAVEGATVYLMPGMYTIPNTGSDGAANRWFTIEGAPGTSRSQVVITTGGETVSQRKLRVRNLTLRQLANTTLLTQPSDPYGNHFWIDNVDIEGLGYIGSTTSWIQAVASGPTIPVWYTDVNIRNTMHTGLNQYVIMARNISAQDIGADFSNMRRLMVNCSVNHMRYNSGVHPDVVQVPVEAIENMIIFGLKATDVACQGITLGSGTQPVKNVAIVNVLLDKIATDPQAQWMGGGSVTDHYLWWNVTWNNYAVMFNGNNITNFSVRNCVMPQKSDTSTMNYPGFNAENNHVTNGQYLFGTNCTSGNPMFTSSTDFHPMNGSPLTNRVTTPLVPVDLDWRPISTSSGAAAIGAFQKR